MDSKIAEQILDELAPTFERIESESAAIRQFLKDKGIATDEQLAPYLEQASAASSVRWRALRVRMGRLFSMAEKSDEEARKKSEVQSAQGTQAEAKTADAKPEATKDKPDHKQAGAAPKEPADADRQRAGKVSSAREREPAKSNDAKEAVQEETGPARADEARQLQDKTSNKEEKKDAA